MNKLSEECGRDILLYRELFMDSSKSLSNYFLDLKKSFSCKKCAKCSNILYIEESPTQILEQKEKYQDFCKFFVPFSSDKFEHVNISLNHKLAKEADSDFVELVLKNSSKEVWFYHPKESCSSVCEHISYPVSQISVLHEGCIFREWQKLILQKIEKEISRDIVLKLNDIRKYRDEFSCNHTGTCCRLACSEFTFEELQKKAQEGDRFAGEFTSIFIPYESIEEARKIYPEFVEMMEQKLKVIYFYHCPHITEDNMCSIYEKRPQLCRDFPDNPLAILPDTCGYCQWKKEVEYGALLMHALIEICGFYKDKLEYLES